MFRQQNLHLFIYFFKVTHHYLYQNIILEISQFLIYLRSVPNFHIKLRRLS